MSSLCRNVWHKNKLIISWRLVLIIKFKITYTKNHHTVNYVLCTVRFFRKVTTYVNEMPSQTFLTKPSSRFIREKRGKPSRITGRMVTTDTVWMRKNVIQSTLVRQSRGRAFRLCVNAVVTPCMPKFSPTSLAVPLLHWRQTTISSLKHSYGGTLILRAVLLVTCYIPNFFPHSVWGSISLPSLYWWVHRQYPASSGHEVKRRRHDAIICPPGVLERRQIKAGSASGRAATDSVQINSCREPGSTLQPVTLLQGQNAYSASARTVTKAYRAWWTEWNDSLSHAMTRQMDRTDWMIWRLRSAWVFSL